MPQLDAMLRALAQKNALELRLEDGSRPVFRFAHGNRPVSQSVLSRAQILRLITELAEGNDAEKVASGRPARFVYRLGEKLAFDCEVAGSNGDFAARISARANPGSASASPTRLARQPGAPDIEDLLLGMVETGASDLHLSAGETPMFRLHGEMIRIRGRSESSPEHTARLVFQILPARNKQEFERTNDTDFAYEIPGVARFRVNVFMDRKGIGAVFRVIPSRILTAEELALPGAVLDLCGLSKGLVLVTGPTGSGKSTTLAAMIDHINRHRTDHVITIEDPIEFVHANGRCLINQREVGTHTAGFKRALRAALREDPDIVLVGEMRDLETIEIAIETAETGHLVFGTLHTTTAASTIDRIIDQFPSDRQGQIRTMLSESLKGVVAQTLVKKIGGGRAAALEVLIAVPAISNLIREGKTFQIPSTMQTGKKHGMTLLNDALLDLVRRKIVKPDDAFAKAIDRAGFASMLRAAGLVPASGVEA